MSGVGAVGCILAVHSLIVDLLESAEEEMPVVVQRMMQHTAKMEELRALEEEFQTELPPASAPLERAKESVLNAKRNVACCRKFLRDAVLGIVNDCEINEEAVLQLTSFADTWVSAPVTTRSPKSSFFLLMFSYLCYVTWWTIQANLFSLVDAEFLF